MKQFLTVCALLLLATCLQVQGQACSGVRVEPNLPDFNHNVSGVLYIEDTTSYCIEDFYYDGRGPDAFLYLYLPGDPPFIKGGGVTTPVLGREDIRMGQFELGRSYLGERLRFNVPEGHRTCDYGAFGIWCRYASQLFTAVTSLERYFSSNGTAGTVMCTRSPGRAFLGSLPMTNNRISGDVFAVSDKQFTIRNFTYDGSGGSAVKFYFFPAGETASPSSTTGVALDTAVAASAALELIFPDGMTMFSCDYGTLALWDGNSASGFLASLTIDLSTAFTNNQDQADHDRSLVFCDRPSTRPGVLVGDLPTDSNSLDGTLYVQDSKTLYVQLFSYDARGDDAFLYYYRRGQAVEDSGHGYRVGFSASIEQLPTGTSNSYKKSTPFVIDLNNALDEDDVSACDLGWFTVWSQGTQEHFTRIQIPMDIFTEDPDDAGIAAKTKILCSQTAAVPTPRADGAPPTVSLISGLIVCLVAMAVTLLKA